MTWSSTNCKSAGMAGLIIVLFAAISCKSPDTKPAAVSSVKRNRSCKVATDCVAYLSCGNTITAFNKKSVTANDHLLGEAQPADREFPAEPALYSVNPFLCLNILSDGSSAPTYEVKCKRGLCEVILGN